jgi:hypothetical protein
METHSHYGIAVFTLCRELVEFMWRIEVPIILSSLLSRCARSGRRLALPNQNCSSHIASYVSLS